MYINLPTWVYEVIAAVVLAIGSYVFGYHVASKAFSDYKLVQESLSSTLHEQREKENKELKERYQQQTKQAQDELYKANTKLSELYATTGKLRIKASTCSSPSGQTSEGNSRGTTGATTGTWELPQGITNDLFSLTKRADVLVEQCRAMQKVCVEK